MERLLNLRFAAYALVLCSSTSFAQQLMSDKDVLDQMRYDIQYLASDELQGRETGTVFERMAADYVIGKFSNEGLMPYGDSATFLQAFTFAGDPVVGECMFGLNRLRLKLGDDYFPLDCSDTGLVRTRVARCGYGINAPQLGRNDFEGVDVKDHAAVIMSGLPDGNDPHGKWGAFDLRKRIEDAVALGANAVIVYNDDPHLDDPSPELRARTSPCTVPVVFVKKHIAPKLGTDGGPVALRITIDRPQRVGHNVVGFLDNGQANVVVIGAHMDHLGHGIEGSLYRGDPAIHNGADDNASGVSVMMQLARDLHNMPEAHNNDYLFIAFSGEELGLFGSNWFVKHATVPLTEINYMINLDMVGRLDTASNIAISGVGTSPAWSEVEKVLVGKLKVKTSASGVGPSDHTSFYLKDIPVLHFFTGAHDDYHKPSDDEEKINYNGMLRVTRFIESLITTLNDDGKLTFTKTQDADSSETPRFKVTLGVVPDYMFDGKGMRIDGVTDGKPASIAGLKTGDVVVKLGELSVTDMMSYMKALAAFKKGDSTTVTVVREGKEMNANITFK